MLPPFLTPEALVAFQPEDVSRCILALLEPEDRTQLGAISTQIRDLLAKGSLIETFYAACPVRKVKEGPPPTENRRRSHEMEMTCPRNRCNPQLDKHTLLWHIAKAGNLDVLNWLIQGKGLPIDASAWAGAATGGHMDVVQRLLELEEGEQSWDARACRVAAAEGHVDVIAFLHENGAPWDKEVCSEAARHGHLRVLQYARENGCPWDERVISNDGVTGHSNVIRWAVQHQAPGWQRYRWAYARQALTSHKLNQVVKRCCGSLMAADPLESLV